MQHNESDFWSCCIQGSISDRGKTIWSFPHLKLYFFFFFNLRESLVSYLFFYESYCVFWVCFLCFFDLCDSIRAHSPQWVFSLVAELFGYLGQVLPVLPSHSAGKREKCQKWEAKQKNESTKKYRIQSYREKKGRWSKYWNETSCCMPAALTSLLAYAAICKHKPPVMHLYLPCLFKTRWSLIPARFDRI